MEALAMVGVAAAAFALGAVTFGRRERRSALVAAEARRRDDEVRLETDRLAGAERDSMSRILSGMEEGVALFAPDGRMSFANPGLTRHLGSRPPSVGAVLPLGLQDAVRAAGRERTATSAEVETGSPPRWLGGSAIPVGDDGSVLLMVRDVTEARRLDAIRRDFVANASHELKTPAASIQAAAETIGTASLDDPAVIPRFAAQLEREAVRLSRIVSELLDLTRLESGSPLDEAVALDAVLRDELERFESTAADAGVALSAEVAPTPRVLGSARDLALLIRNLVDNAIRYSKQGGAVQIRLGSDDGEVVLTVADTGLGIPSRELPRIFERFYRVDRARARETGGTGLGLSIVKHVAENHGGRVDVRSELGLGSRFEVRLPAGPDA